MGCGCIGPSSKDKYAIENIVSSKYASSKKELTSIYPLTDYVKKVFHLINKIRKNPQDFISVIEQGEKYIKEINGRKIFEDNGLKVSLNEGKTMFKDCAEYLKTLKPMDELNFCDDIVLECPKEENKIKDKNIFKEKVLEKKDKFGILAYFKDSIYIPEISVLLMMVDDAVQSPRKKRETLLNPNFKFIGISSSDYDSNKSNENKKEDNKEKNKEEENNKEKDNKDNNNNENNEIKNDDTNNKNKKNESKYKAFCAYFTLK